MTVTVTVTRRDWPGNSETCLAGTESDRRDRFKLPVAVRNPVNPGPWPLRLAAAARPMHDDPMVIVTVPHWAGTTAAASRQAARVG